MKKIKEISPERKRELQEASVRMRMLLDEFHLNYAKIGRLTGRGRGDVFRNIVEERNVISVEIADDICRIFPQINYKWIYAGVEPMKIPTGEIPVKIESNKIKETKTSECKVCIANERTIIAQERTIKLLENENEKLKKMIERRNNLGGSGTISDTTPETKTGTR